MSRFKTVFQPTPRAWFDPQNLEGVYGKYGAAYLGTDNLLPDVESYYNPPLYRGGKTLIKEGDSVILRDNLCLHRQVPLLEGLYGTLLNGHTVCPVHRWTYDRNGAVVGNLSGFCKESVGKLRVTPVGNVDGHLFARTRQADAMENMLREARKFDTSLFNTKRFAKDRGLVRVVQYPTPYSLWLFVLNYLDVLHVGPYHKNTFAEVADCGTLAWEFGEAWSMQVIKPALSIAPSAQGLWAKLARRMYEKLPEARDNPFALWGLVNPELMFELYFGHFLAVSYLVPTGPRSCVNVVEYYMSDEAWLELGVDAIDDFIKAYRSSADEDDEICVRMQSGLEILEAEEEVLHGPFHDPMEEGMVRWLEWLYKSGFKSGT